MQRKVNLGEKQILTSGQNLRFTTAMTEQIKAGLYEEKDGMLAAQTALTVMHTRIATAVYKEDKLLDLFKQCK